MAANYLLRFDDICPTMNWSVWDQVESILNKHNIKPILAVVPDNQDPELIMGPARPDFWEKVRAWQNKGWTIALHGYQHVYSTQESGLTKINNYSEFVGFSYQEQLEKLQKGLAIFADHGVTAEAWIAPAHSFDELTIKALLNLGINVISDGYYFRPINRLGATWIPQQLWRFRKMSFGLWTVCFHTDEFLVQDDVDKFARRVEQFAPLIMPFNQALKAHPAKAINWIDKLMEYSWHYLLKLKSTF